MLKIITVLFLSIVPFVLQAQDGKLIQTSLAVYFFEGADHGIREWRSERFAQTRRHFDYYLRDGQPWPSMEKHGK